MPKLETFGNLETVKRIFYNDTHNFKENLTDDFKYYEGIYDEEIGNLPDFILKNKVTGIIQMVPKNVIRYLFARFICVKEDDKHVIKSYWIVNVKEKPSEIFDTDGFNFSELTKEDFYDKFSEVNELFICDEKLH